MLVLQPDDRDPDHAQPVPHRCGSSVEFVPLDPLRSTTAEIRLRKIRGAGSPNHGATVRRTETQSSPHADRRRGSSRKVVFRFEECDVGSEKERRRIQAPNERARHIKVEKLGTRTRFGARIPSGVKLLNWSPFTK